MRFAKTTVYKVESLRKIFPIYKHKSIEQSYQITTYHTNLLKMSDTGRKGVGEQLKEKATPQDQKVFVLFPLLF